MRVLEMAAQEAFVLETLDTTGRIYNLCRYELEISLQRAWGETMPQAVLRVLAGSPEGPSLIEVARARPQPSWNWPRRARCASFGESVRTTSL